MDTGSNENRGGNWISWTAEQAIKRQLNACNGSQPNVKRIARLASVSRNTVTRFVDGRRKFRKDRPKVLEPPSPEVVGEYRCVCGYLVYLKPCQICAALERKKNA